MTAYVVQAVEGTAIASPGTITLASTTAGNTLLAMVSLRNAGTANAALSNVTLGGVQDNFAYLKDYGSATSAGGHLYWWLDPLCAGGQTSVAFTTTGGNGNLAMTMAVLEVGSLIPVPTGSFDATSGVAGTSASTSWTSGTQPSNWPTEIWAGAVVASGTPTVAPQGYPWTTMSPLGNGTISVTAFAYQLRPSLGSAGFSGTLSGSQTATAGVVTLPAITTSPGLPDFLAGAGYQQGDALSMITAPLGFAQQLVVFRAAQLTTTTTLASGNPGTISTIAFDTILEDPYQGWNASTSTWIPPFTGWYRIYTCVSVGTSTGLSILQQGSSALVVPASGGIHQASYFVFGVAGQAAFSSFANMFSSSNVLTSNNPPSTLEICWTIFAAS